LLCLHTRAGNLSSLFHAPTLAIGNWWSLGTSMVPDRSFSVATPSISALPQTLRSADSCQRPV
jgi:hypothetical protein